MKHIKRMTMTAVLTVLMVGGSFGNTGIIVNGISSDEDTKPCMVETDKGVILSDYTGIIVNGLTGIIVNGFTGIIVNGFVDSPVDCGINIKG